MCEYKISKFNNFVKYNGNIICFNSLSGSQVSYFGAKVSTNDIIGYINKNGNLDINLEKLTKWTEWFLINDKVCKFCNFRPICHGGCKSRKMDNFFYCSRIKNNYSIFLDWYVDKYLPIKEQK